MALENLIPVVREERLLTGEDIEPATRLEYFLKQAGSGGSGSVDYEPVLSETTKSVNEHGWSTSFSGGPILEGVSYRVIVNGVTYEPLIGTAGDLGYICLGNTYVDDADPTGDYPFGIFYKNDTLTAWLETGESITMQVDQIIQAVPVPTPAAADAGKVLTVNEDANGVEWKAAVRDLFVVTETDGVLNKTWTEIYTALSNGMIGKVLYVDAGITAMVKLLNFAQYDGEFYFVYPLGDTSFWYQTSTANGYPELQLD